MAAIAPSRVEYDTRFQVWEWSPLVNTAVGAPIYVGDFNDLTFKAFGTFGAGGEVTILGSLNLPGTTTDAGNALEEESGVPILLTSVDSWATSRSAPLQVWPLISGGDGTTSVTVRAVIRR